jgi:hypothetical protein
MSTSIPFLTSYDPPGTSEGALDPLGLYQIADQLAVQLVPAVRERMQRIRFLTTMTVGSLVTEGLEDDPRHRDASPTLVWEWLVVEALVREASENGDIRGVPGVKDADSAATPQLAAPVALLRTPRLYQATVSIEMLPETDPDRNRRPWHAKMMALLAEQYSALMIGSSNFTSAGM